MTTYFGQNPPIIRPIYTAFEKKGMRCNVEYIILLLFLRCLTNYCSFRTKF